MSPFLSSMLFVIAVLAWVAVIAGLCIWSCECFEGGRPLLGSLCVAASAVTLAAGIAFAATQGSGPEQACLESGKAWAIVGHHRAVVYHPALKVALPTDVDEYGCVDRR